MKKQLISVATAALCLLGGAAPYMPVNSMICAQAEGQSEKIESSDGYIFTVWNNDDSGRFTHQEGDNGTWKGSWESVNDGSVVSGKSLKNISNYNGIDFDYELDIAMDSYKDMDNRISNICYYGACGYFNDSGFETTPTEFHVIDGWYNWKPPKNDISSAEKLGEVISNGCTYDLYKTKSNTPGYGGNQFWSVKRESPMKDGEVSASGKICLNDHIEAWKKLGLDKNLKIEHVGFEITAFRSSSGSFELKKNDIKINTEGSSISSVSGDLNGDGKVNVFDIVLCRKAIINGTADAEFMASADINKDGKVNVADLVRMSRFVTCKAQNFEALPDVEPTTEAPVLPDFNDVSLKDGYTFEVWNQESQGSAEAKDISDAGKCSFEWSDVRDAVMRSGMTAKNHNMEIAFNQLENLVVDYDAVLNANGENIAAVYGWFTKPEIEWYIVEGWTGKDFPLKDSSELLDTADINGIAYDVYKKTNTSSQTYYFVKKDGSLTEGKEHKLSGSVNVKDFIKLLKGYEDGAAYFDSMKLFNVNFMIEGLDGSSGKAEIGKNDISVSGVPFDEYYFSETSRLYPDIELKEVKSFATEEKEGYTMYAKKSDGSSEKDSVYYGFGETDGLMRGRWTTSKGAHYSSGLNAQREYPLSDNFMNDYSVSYTAFAKFTGNFELGVGVTLDEPNVKVRIIDYWHNNNGKGMHDAGNIIGRFSFDGNDYTVYRELNDTQEVYSFVSSTGSVGEEALKQKFKGKLKVSEFLRNASKELELGLGEEALFVGTIIDVENGGTGEFDLTDNTVFLSIKDAPPKFDVSDDQMQEVDGHVKKEIDGYRVEAFVSSGSSASHNEAYYAFGESGGQLKGRWNAEYDVVYSSMRDLPKTEPLNKVRNYEVEYSAKVDCSNIFSLGAYALFNNYDYELEIINSWGVWRPSGNDAKIGTYTSLGVRYDIYKIVQSGDLGMGGSIHTRYICVPDISSPPDSDTGIFKRRINVTDALKALYDLGQNPGELSAVGTEFTAFNSKGEFTLLSNTIRRDHSWF
ncbi:MAG: glycoside hydrolase family 11 protein [Ruminococcus sp.]|nr:glycoside hydrolase family 11 protein [Ruminococcus sp.]